MLVMVEEAAAYSMDMSSLKQSRHWLTRSHHFRLTENTEDFNALICCVMKKREQRKEDYLQLGLFWGESICAAEVRD